MSNPVIIQTEKEGLVLRELSTSADDAAYFESYNASRPEIAAFDEDAPTRYLSIEDVEASRLSAERTGKLRLGMWDGDTFVGSINMTPDPIEDSAEIGYWVDSRYTGQGYTTLATKALAGYAAKRYKTVHAEVLKGNDASARVLEKSGFIQRLSEDPGKLSFILPRG